MPVLGRLIAFVVFLFFIFLPIRGDRIGGPLLIGSNSIHLIFSYKTGPIVMVSWHRQCASAGSLIRVIAMQATITEINHAIGATGVVSQECKAVVEQYGQTILALLLAEVLPLFNPMFFRADQVGILRGHIFLKLPISWNHDWMTLDSYADTAEENMLSDRSLHLRRSQRRQVCPLTFASHHPPSLLGGSHPDGGISLQRGHQERGRR